MGVMKLGVVRFDTSDPSQGGWVSVEGERARRINGPGALSNDTLWWSSLTFDDMYRANIRTPYIKLTTYCTSWSTSGEPMGQNEICMDWGFMHRNFSDQEITEALSAIFASTMRFVERHYGLDLAKEVPQQASLADELRVLLLPEKDEHFTPEVDAALEAAYQPYTYCVFPRHDLNDYVHVQMIVPPVRYAHEVLDVVVPESKFNFIGADQLPRDPAARLEWVLAQENPVLARIRVSDVSPEYAPVLAFGNGAKSGCNRTWASHPELLLLSKYATIEIESAFVFGGYEPLDNKLRLPRFSGLQEMTPTADIIASNHWIGLARSNPWTFERRSRGRAWSPRAIWINAIDRFLMFTYALRLYRAGIAVYRYGAGRITAVVPKYHYRDAYEVATSCGLLAPPSITPDIRIQRGLQDYG